MTMEHGQPPRDVFASIATVPHGAVRACGRRQHDSSMGSHTVPRPAAGGTMRTSSMRMVGDSNPRWLFTTLAFQASALDHYANHPSQHSGSNRRPDPYKGTALPSELCWQCWQRLGHARGAPHFSMPTILPSAARLTARIMIPTAMLSRTASW